MNTETKQERLCLILAAAGAVLALLFAGLWLFSRHDQSDAARTAQAEAAVAAVAEGFRAVALAEGIVHELRCDARERIGIRDAAQARQLRRERREDLPANVRARGGRRRKDRRLHLGPDGGERRSPTRDARERKSLQLIEQRRERAAGCGRLELRITPPTVTAVPSVVQRRRSSAVTVSTRIFPGTSSARLRRSSGVMGSCARNAR